VANYTLIFEENLLYPIAPETGNNKPLILVNVAALIGKKIDIAIARDDLKFELEAMMELITVAPDDLTMQVVEDFLTILFSGDDLNIDQGDDDLRIEHGV